MPRLPVPFDPTPEMVPGTDTATALEEEPEPLLELPGREHDVLLTGATGFVAGHLLPRLHHRGHRVRAVSRRPQEEHGGPVGEQVEWCRADLIEDDSIRGLAEGCDRVVHLAGTSAPTARGTAPSLDVEGTRRVVAEAARAGVERFVFMSALGAGRGDHPFSVRKALAEREVLSSSLETVVFRPAVIYGPGDYLTSRLRSLVGRYRALPVLGRCDFHVQPLAVEDAVEAVCQAMERPAFGERVYELGGPSALDFDEIVRAVGDALGSDTRVLELPAVLDGVLGRAARLLRREPPLRAEEVGWLRALGSLGEGEHALREVFRLEPLPFRDVLADYF